MGSDSGTAFRTDLRIDAEAFRDYLAWKTDELGVLAATAGYRASLVFRDAADPTAAHSVTLWSDGGDPARLQRSAAYREAADRHGVSLFPAHLRDGATNGSADQPADSRFVPRFPVLARTACDVVTGAAVADPVLPAGSYVYWYEVDVGPGGARAYEDFKSIPGHAGPGVPGFRYRVLLRHRAAPTVYTYISVWDSRAASREFHAVFSQTADYRDMRARMTSYSRPPSFTDAELLCGRTGAEKGGGGVPENSAADSAENSAENSTATRPKVM